MKHIRILIIEDDYADVDIMKEALPDGILYLFEHVTDGEHACKYFDRFNPDIIFLDLNLPKVSGKDLLREFKGNCDYKHVPIIVISTSSASEDIKFAYNHGANAYLSKTSDFASFERKLKATGDFWFHTANLPNIE